MRQHQYAVRRAQQRKPLPVIVVVCDDAKTAVSYFSLLKKQVQKELTLTVVRNPCDRATASDVVAEAKEWLTRLTESRAHDDSDTNSIWALVDLEGTVDRKSAAQRAKHDAQNHGINVALSNPCYELWTLLHLVDTGQSFVDCRAVLARLEQEWKQEFGQGLGKKGQADYSKILRYQEKAVARAKKHRDANDPSWTEVYQVIEAINSFVANPSSGPQPET